MAEAIDELQVVGEWPSIDEAHDRALVVLALFGNCRVSAGVDGYAVEVARRFAPQAMREIEAYDSEVFPEPAPPDPRIYDLGFRPAIAWALSLMIVFYLQQRVAGVTDHFANSSLAVFREHEWWRPFTSLFLHADGEHLLGNVLLGGFYCVLVATSFGAVRGWALILASGLLGNLATAWVHFPENFRSIGASTATFGALGLITGAAMRNAWSQRRYRALKPLIVPLGAAGTLLGWQGAGGENTDVLGHLLGCLAGVLLGVIATEPVPANAADNDDAASTAPLAKGAGE